MTHGEVFIFGGALANNGTAILEAKPRPTTTFAAGARLLYGTTAKLPLVVDLPRQNQAAKAGAELFRREQFVH